MMQVAGTFTADGSGNITAGGEDFVFVDPHEAGFGSIASFSLTGSYSVGPDNRGSMILTAVGSSFTDSQSFWFSLSDFSSTVAGRGRVNLFYPGEYLWSAAIGTGILVRQDPTAFSTAAIQGSYAFGLGENRARPRAASPPAAAR
jgi:hypothetical protein